MIALIAYLVFSFCFTVGIIVDSAEKPNEPNLNIGLIPVLTLLFSFAMPPIVLGMMANKIYMDSKNKKS